MTINARALRHHAADVSEERLVQAHGRLHGLSRDERLAVEETARAVAQGVAGCLLERAAVDETLAGVLATLYPTVGARAAPG